MIKLTNPLLHNGRIIPAGATVGGLSQSFEKALIAAGNAIACGSPEPEPEFDKLEPQQEPEHDETESDAGQEPEVVTGVKLGR